MSSSEVILWHRRRWWHSVATMVLMILACGSGLFAADAYYYTNPSNILLQNKTLQVTQPADNNQRWLAGSKHTVQCNRLTDSDCKFVYHVDTGMSQYLGEVDDVVTTCWLGTSGVFQNDDCIGTQVEYVCGTWEGWNSVCAAASDAYFDNTTGTWLNYHRGQTGGNEGPEGPGGYDGWATSEARVIYVVGTIVRRLTWEGKYNIYDVAEPEYDADEWPLRSEPASYAMDTPMSAKDVKFYGTYDLTAGSAVKVVACWRELTLEEMFSTEVPDCTILDGDCTWAAWSSLVTLGSGLWGSLPYVFNETLGLSWYYQPSGVTTSKSVCRWIYMINTSHEIFEVYGPPQCSASDYTKTHLRYSTAWGSNGVQVTEDDIPHKIQHNCWLNFGWTHLADPWQLETTVGDCQTHAELMAAYATLTKRWMR